MSSYVKFDDKGFKNMKRALTDSYYVEVGIQGSDAREIHEDSEDETNAEIGAKHEFGVLSKRIPRRSFLLDSLKLLVPDWFQDPRNKERYYDYAVNGEIKKFYEVLSRFCLRVVDLGFKTRGFGKWRPLSQKTLFERRKKGIYTDTQLLATGQLRRSNTSVVRRGKK